MKPIRPEDVLIVVPAFREVPCRPLLEWLRAVERRGYAWRLGPPESRPVTVARNQIVTRFLEEDADKQHLVMINARMVPLPEVPGEASGGGTARILTEPGDVVYCACFGRYGLAGHYPHFDTACFRASRAVYESTPQPWFDFACDPTHTRLTLCECQWFQRRLPEGIEPKRAGAVGRLTEMVVAPNTDGQRRACNPYGVLPEPV
ncbi:MAG: hypothetical protein R6X20_12585 [Phycisphaerae bacterium]